MRNVFFSFSFTKTFLSPPVRLASTPVKLHRWTLTGRDRRKALRESRNPLKHTGAESSVGGVTESPVPDYCKYLLISVEGGVLWQKAVWRTSPSLGSFLVLSFN